MSTLAVNTIQAQTGTNVGIASGHDIVIHNSSAASLRAPGMAINSVEHQWGNQTINTSQSWAALSGSTYSYTTKAANSKIMIIAQGQAYQSAGGTSGFGIGIFRGTTRLYSPYSNWGMGLHAQTITYGATPWHIQHLDAPGAAAGTALSYNLQSIMHTSGQTVYFNYAGSWSGLSNFSSMIITEIAQ